MDSQQRADPTYVMGYSAEERERLIEQAGLFGPITERFLRTAGLGTGMRVLDVGCGVGDVSMLCASVVGAEGEVVGMDRDPGALARARERVAAAELSNARFIEGDFRELPPGESFDAVVGRAVLMYAADPAAALRSLLPHLRSGGIVAFQEFDYTMLIALPSFALIEQLVDWWRRTAGQAGIELQMGLKLFPTYVAAGLPDRRCTGIRSLAADRTLLATHTWLASFVASCRCSSDSALPQRARSTSIRWRIACARKRLPEAASSRCKWRLAHSPANRE